MKVRTELLGCGRDFIQLIPRLPYAYPTLTLQCGGACGNVRYMLHDVRYGLR